MCVCLGQAYLEKRFPCQASPSEPVRLPIVAGFTPPKELGRNQGLLLWGPGKYHAEDGCIGASLLSPFEKPRQRPSGDDSHG